MGEERVSDRAVMEYTELQGVTAKEPGNTSCLLCSSSCLYSPRTPTAQLRVGAV
jgi:hypothetical protein